jgi:hypothetical protein
VQRVGANGNAQVAQLLNRKAAMLVVVKVGTCATHFDATIPLWQQ